MGSARPTSMDETCRAVGSEEASVRFPIDHKFDDNADDSCAPNYAYDTAFRLLNSLSSDPARSWQCGGHGFDAPSLHPA